MTNTTAPRRFQITNRSTGADFGVYDTFSQSDEIAPLDALAAMHRDAGYDVAISEDGTELVFASEADRDLCGGPEAWRVTEV